MLPQFFFFSLSLLLVVAGPATATAGSVEPLIIAHRGASGYLPEHTLEAKALAYGMQPDFIEQDLVLSRDGHLIVMHDIYLDAVTDVADRFPDRARQDGHFYTIDFSLAELKQLRVTEAFRRRGDQFEKKYPDRFPLWKSSFQLSTFREEIELIQGLNQSLGYDIGIYPEIKKPWFHHREGQDIALRALEVLKQYGYHSREQKVFLQSFDPEELQRIDSELMPQMEMDLPLVQLIAETSWGEKQVEREGFLVNYSYDWMREPGGLEKVSSYADAIGPWAMMLLQKSDNSVQASPLRQRAKERGLPIHAFTFRADKLPEGIKGLESFDALLSLFVHELAIEGLFTDHPDKARAFIQRHQQPAASKTTPVPAP